MRGVPIAKTTLIDRKTLAIVGHYLHDSQHLIASWEIKEFYAGTFPKKIIITWHEEKSQTQWEMDQPRVFQERGIMSSKNWELPNREPRLDLGNEHRVKVSFWPQ